MKERLRVETSEFGRENSVKIKNSSEKEVAHR